jgi:Cellulase (glycosyl hydrolase family 5)
VVKEADKYSVHLIIALADGDVDNNCDPEDASGGGKTAAYYTNAVQAGSPYANWVQSVVTPLANDPGVAMWEIINEPWHQGATFDQVDAVSYVNAAATLIRNAETAGAGKPKQLITLGTVDIGETGGVSGMEAIFKNLDVVDDHDYAWDYNGKSEISGDFSSLQTIAKALNKPFMVDEAGVEGGSSCNGSNGLSLADRVTYLITKANDYLSSSGGASALGIWLYTGENNGGCAYENINTSDPIMAAVKNYQMPN